MLNYVFIASWIKCVRRRKANIQHGLTTVPTSLSPLLNIFLEKLFHLLLISLRFVIKQITFKCTLTVAEQKTFEKKLICVASTSWTSTSCSDPSHTCNIHISIHNVSESHIKTVHRNLSVYVLWKLNDAEFSAAPCRWRCVTRTSLKNAELRTIILTTK